MINPGTKLPQFTADACVSIEAGSEFATIDSAALEGQWNVLYTYPKDFTFVCPTEIVEFDRILPELERRNAALFGGSTDNEYS
ncbi:MAG: redoxin domain-containing protein, partial [Myxococcota bacterium]